MGIQAIVDPILASFALPSVAGGLGTAAAGLGADAATAAALGTAGSSALGGALTGSALGAGEAAFTGGNPLKGAEAGAIGGGVTGGLGPTLGGITGLGTTAGDALAGAAGGALGGAVTGQPTLASALTGAAGGALTGALSSGGTPTGAVGGGPSSAAGAAAPTGVASTSAPADITSIPGASQFQASTTGQWPQGLDLNQAGGPLTPTAGTSGPLASSSGALDSLGHLGTSLTSSFKNPGVLVAGGGLLLDALRGNKPPPYSGPLGAEAKQLTSQGAQLEGYINSGQLPPGLQASLDAAHESAAASIRSQYAARGMSGSSAEAQDLQNLARNTVGQGAQTAIQLFNSGVSESQLGANLYETLMRAVTAQDQQLSQGIAGFATALAGANRPVTPQTTAGT